MVRVLVADDNEMLREMLAGVLNCDPRIEVVGVASNGVEVMEMIREKSPEVVVCDIVMPQMDGFGVLEQVTNEASANPPRIIALTALDRGDFISHAVDLGVSYYMVKPADTSYLIQRILKLAETQAKAAPASEPSISSKDSNEQAVARMLMQMGMPTHLKGYRFLLYSVLLTMADPSRLGAITRNLYPAVAQHYNTTASRVERSIRHAIENTWARGTVHNFAPRLVDKPTNCEMIAFLTEKLRLGTH